MGFREIQQRLERSFAAIEKRTAVASESDNSLRIPARDTEVVSSDEAALGFIPIFRAAQILTTSASQLPLEQHRGQKIIDNKASILVQPDWDIDLEEWIETAVLSLAFDGNLFLHVTRNSKNQAIRVQVLPPKLVGVTQDPKTFKVSYWYKGKELKTGDVIHKKFMATPGSLRGSGPIQAARQEIKGALDVRNYATKFFENSKQPSGLLTGASIETPEQGKAAQKYWNDTVNDPENISGIRVLGGDLTYTPLYLSPSEVQWLDVRKFSVTDFARLFGIPSALMLVSLDGNSLTYSNVEQEWVAFTRFTLTAYLRKIEQALSTILPMGSKARFNIDALLRADTASRYSSYQTGIQAGFLTVNEVRKIEGLAPLKEEVTPDE